MRICVSALRGGYNTTHTHTKEIKIRKKNTQLMMMIVVNMHQVKFFN